MSDIVTTADLAGANETVDKLVEQLRALHACGLAPSAEEMALATLNDVGIEDWRRVLARSSLMLAIAIQRLAEAQ